MSIKKLRTKIEQLRVEDAEKVLLFVEGLLSIDHELLNYKESECIKQLGYNPTHTMEDHEWEAMLKRNQMSLEKESK